MGHWLASPHKIPRGDWRPVRCGEPESHPTPIRPPRSARTQSRTDPSEYISELQVAARVVFAAVDRAERYLSRSAMSPASYRSEDKRRAAQNSTWRLPRTIHSFRQMHNSEDRWMFSQLAVRDGPLAR